MKNQRSWFDCRVAYSDRKKASEASVPEGVFSWEPNPVAPTTYPRLVRGYIIWTAGIEPAKLVDCHGA